MSFTSFGVPASAGRPWLVSSSALATVSARRFKAKRNCSSTCSRSGRRPRQSARGAMLRSGVEGNGSLGRTRDSRISLTRIFHQAAPRSLAEARQSTSSRCALSRFGASSIRGAFPWGLSFSGLRWCGTPPAPRRRAGARSLRSGFAEMPPALVSPPDSAAAAAAGSLCLDCRSRRRRRTR